MGRVLRRPDETSLEAREEILLPDLDDERWDRAPAACGTANLLLLRMEADREDFDDFDRSNLLLTELLVDLIDIGRERGCPSPSTGTGSEGQGTVGGWMPASSTLLKLSLRVTLRCRNDIRRVRLSLL